MHENTLAAQSISLSTTQSFSPVSSPSFVLEKLSDGELLRLCQEYGQKALLWRRRFAGLLPEVNRRKLYKKQGCHSIFEFAAKFAGFSREYTDRILGTEKNLQKAPLLRKMLVNGEVSINKLARIVSIATPQNQEALAEQVKLLSQSALETLVRDERIAFKASGLKHMNALLEPKIEVLSVRTHENSPHLSESVKLRLAGLEAKGIDINALLTEMLDRREKEIIEEKATLTESQGLMDEVQHDLALTLGKPLPKAKRYIPVAVRKALAKEHGTKCATPTCQKPAQTLHHTARFALTGSHDPHYLAPLCKEHHEIAHTIDVKMQERRTDSLRR